MTRRGVGIVYKESTDALRTMTTSSATVDHARALEAIGRADWFLAQAFTVLVPVLHASLYVEGAEPDAVTDVLLAAITEVQTLGARFTEAKGLGG